MDVYEAMEKRCSVRSYQDKPVEADRLERVLNAGRIAPSAGNKQDWKFVVVQDAKVRKEMAEAASQKLLARAPIVIAAVATNPVRVMRCKVRPAPVDCAIAIDHMTLAAVAEGLGTCWIGSFDQEACCKILAVPQTAQIIELLVLGYPDEPIKPKSRKALDEVVCYGKFE